MSGRTITKILLGWGGVKGGGGGVLAVLGETEEEAGGLNRSLGMYHKVKRSVLHGQPIIAL